MVINFWIIKDAGVDESLYQSFVDAFSHEKLGLNSTLKYCIVATKTVLSSDKEYDGELMYCTELRKDLNISDDVYLVYLTSTLTQGRLSNSNFINNIVIYAGDWGESISTPIAPIIFLTCEELLTLTSNKFTQRKPEQFSEYKTWAIYNQNKHLEELIKAATTVFPGNIPQTYEWLITKRNEVKNSILSENEKHFQLEIIQSLFVYIKWNNDPRRPLFEYGEFISIELDSITHKIKLANGDEKRVTFAPKDAAVYTLFLLWFNGEPQDLNNISEKDLAVLHKMYVYYRKTYIRDQFAQVNNGFFKYIDQTRKRISETLEKSLDVSFKSSETYCVMEPYLLINKVHGRYQLLLPKHKIRIPKSHRLIDCVNPRNEIVTIDDISK